MILESEKDISMVKCSCCFTKVEIDWHFLYILRVIQVQFEKQAEKN